MSTTIDEKVVEMRFDNRNFEKNVQGTLSTLDKLKQKLNLTGASKGLENIGQVANKIDMSGMSNAVDTVRSRFSALEVMGITALANITNSAVNAGKRIVKSLTVEPVMDGWQEYELTLNSVQTTMNATGKTAKEVEEELKRLDDYADKTVYSTADMLNNLPKFTNAGVELEKATTAMIGIANATALAGGDASKASIAFYNLGQAIGTGYLTRMDYNSINNAGIATMEWKEQMVEAAVAAGTLKKANNGLYKAGKKTFTIQQLFIDGLQEQWATTDVMMKVFQDYGNETTEIGKKSWDAATKVKTFTSMMESLKATAGTGWKETWQLIFGDLDAATEFWTGINNFISNIITGMADFRNNLLESVLGKSFVGLLEKINKPLNGVKESIKTLKDYSEIVNEIIRGDWGNKDTGRFEKLTEAGYDWAHAQNLVNEKLGSSVRHATNYKEAQEEITESTNDHIISLMELDEATLKSMGYTDDQIQALKDLAKAADKTGIPIKEFIENIDKINGRWLLIEGFKNIGSGLVGVFKAIGEAWSQIFNPNISDMLFDFIAGFHKLTNALRLTDKDTGELNEKGQKLVRTFKGIFAAIDIVLTIVSGPFKLGLTILKTILEAFNLDILDFTAFVGDAIVGIRDWIDKHNILTKGIKILIDAIKKVKDNIKIWSRENDTLSKKLGSIKTKIQEWINKHETLSKILDSFNTIVKTVKDTISEWISENELLSGVFTNISDALDKVSKKFDEWKQKFKDVDGKYIGEMIIQGLADGITGAAKSVWKAITDIANKVIQWFKDILGIHSPSKVFTQLGQYIIQGLVNGLKFGLVGGGILGVITLIVNKLVGGFKNLDLSKIGIDKIDEFFDGMVNKLKTSENPIIKFFRDTFTEIDKETGEIKVKMTGITSALSMLALALPGFQPGIAALNTFLFYLNNIGVNTVSAIKKGIVNAANAIWEFGRTLIETLRNAIDSHSDSKETIKIGHDFVSGFITGIKDFATLAWNAIKDFGKTCIDIFKSLDLGTVIATGLSIGMLVVGKSLLNTIDNVSKTVGYFGEGFLNITKPFKEFGGLIAQLKDSLKDYMKVKRLDAIANILKGIALAILSLVAAVVILGKIDSDQLWQGVKAIAALAGILILLTAAATALMYFTQNGNAITGMLSGGTIAAIAVALIAIAYMVKQIGSLSWEQYIKGIAGAGIAVLALGAMIYSMRYLRKVDLKEIGNIGKMMVKLSFALLLLVGVIKLAGMLSAEELIKGGIVVGAFYLFVRGLIIASYNVQNKDLDKVGKMISKISFSLLLMIGVIKLASMLNPDELTKGILVVGALGLLCAGLVAISKFAGADADKAGRMMLEISAALALMVVAAKIATQIDPDKLWPAIAAIGVLGALSVALVAVSKFAGENAVKAGFMVMEVAASLLIVTAALYLISKMMSADLWKAVGVVAVLEALVMGLLFASRGVGEFKDTVKNITILLGVLLGAVLILTIIAHYAGNDLAKAVGAVSVIVSSMAFLMHSLNGTKNVNWKTIGQSLLMMVGVAAIVGTLAFALSKLNVNLSIETASAIAELLLAMSSALLVVSKVRKVTNDALIGIAAMTGVVAALAIILGIMDGLKVEGSIKTATAIGILLMAMSASLVILGFVGPAASAAIPALAELVVVLGLLAGIAGIIAITLGALNSKYPQIEEFLDKGIPLLEKMGKALGSFIGGFIGGIAEGITSSLPGIGQDLSDFMNNANDFIEGSKKIDETVKEGIVNLAACILSLSDAQLISGITSFITFGSSFADLGTNLSNFMKNAEGFLTGSKNIDPLAMQGMKYLAESILILTKADFINGAELFSGNTTLIEFGKQLAAFGPYMKQYSDSVVGINGQAISDSAIAAKGMVEVANAIGNDGGVISLFTGDNKLEVFGARLVVFGQYLKQYANDMAGVNYESLATSTLAVDELVKIKNKIGNDGGVVSWFTGDNKLDVFGARLVLLGQYLKTYGTYVKDLDHESMSMSVLALDEIVKIKEKLGNDGGVVSWFTGDNGLDDFGKALSNLGEDLITYSNSVKGLDHAAMADSIIAINGLKGMLAGLDGKEYDIDGFSDALKQVGKKGIEKFADGMNNGESQVTRAFNSIVTAIKKQAEEKYSTFKTIGETIVKKVAEAIRNTSENARKAFSSILSFIIADIRNKYSSFYGAGEYVVSGFASGITANTFAAEAAAKAMAEKALEAAREKLREHSPSRAFYDIGDYAGQGFVNALIDSGSIAYRAGSGMAEQATNGLSRAIARISDVINSDIDTQPTIRPVLDLSDVESGAGYISSMFNNGPSIGVTSNLRAISSGMNAKLQNGTNDDVVSAIDKLRKGLGNDSGNTYIINGVTYDDGSNINNAVKDLIRAAKIERRT